MDPELLLKVSILEKQGKETEGEIDFVEREIVELERFSDNLDYLSNSKDDSILASMGKGVLIKTQITEKKLFVDVGSGVILRKEPQELKQIIQEQIARLKEARVRLVSRVNIIQASLQQIIKEIEDKEKQSS